MLESQERAGPHSRFMHGRAVNDGIRPCEINILENAHGRLCLAAVVLDGTDAVLIDDHNFSGLQIPFKPGAYGVESAAFRRENNRAVRALSIAERAEAVRVTDRDQLGRRHHDKRKRAVNPVYHVVDRLFNAGSMQAFSCNQIRNDLGIGR